MLQWRYLAGMLSSTYLSSNYKAIKRILSHINTQKSISGYHIYDSHMHILFLEMPLSEVAAMRVAAEDVVVVDLGERFGRSREGFLNLRVNEEVFNGVKKRESVFVDLLRRVRNF